MIKTDRMKRKSYKIALKIVVIAVLTPILISWGAIGHEHINRAAVFSLPDSLLTFFYNHIDFITTESTVPDIRKYALNDKTEDPRHYFDMENFGSPDSFPATLEEVRKKYDENFLLKNGILPWYIEEMMTKLTNAFKEKRKTEILFIAADLGHYIADANTPLHATVNYDGQLTNQKGIHSFWETQLVKMFCNSYNYKSDKAKYIKDIRKEIWRMINASHELADTILSVDRKLKKTFPSDKMYLKDSLGNVVTKSNVPVYSEAYAQQFHQNLNGMIENQIHSSINAVASFWYTAWVNAGRPDLSNLDPISQTKRNRKNLKKEIKLLEKGKLTDIKVGK
jgi:hypothetical protein